MANTIDQSFIRDYNREVYHLFQRGGSYLRNTVSTKTGIVGYSTTFQKMGLSEMTDKGRNGKIPFDDPAHSTVTAYLKDRYNMQVVDDLDQLKTNIDVQTALQKSATMAVGRDIDKDLIATISAGATDVSGTFTIVQTSHITLLQSLTRLVRTLWKAEVPPGDGQTFVVVPLNVWASLLAIPQFTSGDYAMTPGSVPVPIQSMGTFPMYGTWRPLMGAWFGTHSGTIGAGGAAAEVYAYHKTAVGHAIGQEVTTTASELFERDAWGFKTKLSMGSVVILGEGVVKTTADDQAATAPTPVT